MNGTMSVEGKLDTEQECLFGDEPVCIKCPFCKEDIVTSLSYHAGTLSWFFCGLLIFLGLWMGCCIISFYVNVLNDCIHSCPNCWQTLGRYNRI